MRRASAVDGGICCLDDVLVLFIRGLEPRNERCCILLLAPILVVPSWKVVGGVVDMVADLSYMHSKAGSFI